MSRSPSYRLKRRWWLPLLIVILAIAVIAADQRGWLLVPGHSDFEYYHGSEARVVRVIDGDTIDVALVDPLHNTPLTRVRLWGVDAPEFAREGAPTERFATESKAYVESLALDRMVRLHLEPARVRGRYDRVLAHVELPDGMFLNRAVLMEGLATEDDRWPHARLMWYEQAERIARQQQRGMWGPDAAGE